MNKFKKTIQKKNKYKFIGLIGLSIFTLLISADIFARSYNAYLQEANKTDEPAIKCPFLAISNPSMENRKEFVKDVEAFGMDRTMAKFVAFQITSKQKGFWSALSGDAPDIYSLDHVKGVSHQDLFSKYLTELEEMAKATEIEGQITLQDLVEMKKWVAKQENVEISKPSKIETSLLFVKSGGNLETQKVFTEDIFMLLRGIKPKRDAPINKKLLNKSMSLAKWE